MEYNITALALILSIRFRWAADSPVVLSMIFVSSF